MRDILRKAKPQCLDDLIALNALYRPGPLRGGIVDDYIARKHGRVEVKYELPQLEPVLADTYGVIAYQEQVMRLASDLAGFSMGEADLLRKAMGKKNADGHAGPARSASSRAAPRATSTTKKACQDLRPDGALRRVRLQQVALDDLRVPRVPDRLPEGQLPLALHGGAAHHRVAEHRQARPVPRRVPRDAACPSCRPTSTRASSASPSPPTACASASTAVKNVGEGAILSMLGARQAAGRIDSLFRLCEAVDLRLVNKRVLESLVKAGACDSLAGAAGAGAAETARVRACLTAAVDRAIEHGARHQRDRDKGQTQLFGGEGDGEAGAVIPLPAAEPWTEAQQLAFEKEALGLYMSGHPIERHRADLETFGARAIGEFTESAPDVSIGGTVGGTRQLKTKKGDRMAVFVLDDPTGSVEVVVFPEAFGKTGSLIENDAVVIVRGKLEKDDEQTRMVAAEILPIAALRERVTTEVAVHLSVPPHGRGTFEAVAAVLARHRGDRRVALELDLRGQPRPLRVRADVAMRVRPSERLVAELEQLVGQGSVELR